MTKEKLHPKLIDEYFDGYTKREAVFFETGWIGALAKVEKIIDRTFVSGTLEIEHLVDRLKEKIKALQTTRPSVYDAKKESTPCKAKVNQGYKEQSNRLGESRKGEAKI